MKNFFLFSLVKVVSHYIGIVITGTKTSHHGLNIVGYRRATYTLTKGCKIVKFS